ncbi:cysteine--tRNA ligase [Patescibacteria group bacterium]|nr:cysteine--tRNA ligase [Patescibacteria group bacterium]
MFKLYNTKTKKKEIFKSKNKILKIYSCGPTVYDYAHIGNFSTYISVDFLRRYLIYLGYKLEQVMNITDVGHLKVSSDNDYDLNSKGDKIEIQAKKENIDPYKIVEKYTNAFLIDMKSLNISKPEYLVSASSNVEEMQTIILELLRTGYAYVSKNENIYFDVSKFKNYGKLSGKNLDDLIAGAGGRINVSDLENDKKNIFDFSLWITDENHIMKWPFKEAIKSGKMGYPGWHIECSAMSMKYLSKALNGKNLNKEKFNTIDIHTGGEDNIFPHHEDEIAQTEACTGKEFSNFWFHRSHILVNGEKMSKSKGNFYTISDLKEKGFSPLDYRFLVLSAHYKSNLNFTLKSLKQARENRIKIENCYKNILEIPENNNFKKLNIKKYKSDFEKALEDDLNTPLALSIFLEFVKNINKLNFEISNKEELERFFNDFDSIFKIIEYNKNKKIPKEIIDFANKRLLFKNERNYQEADILRDEIDKLGYEIFDKKNGFEIKRKEKIEV